MQSVVTLAAKPRRTGGKILLVKPPYFTPWTPPLGIAILKSYLQQHGFQVKCLDLNTDAELWGMHHEYFSALQSQEEVSINDGYSQLWWIIVAHMLAYNNGADAAQCAEVLEKIIPIYRLRCDSNVINKLNTLIANYFARLKELVDGLDLADYSTVGTSTYTTSLASSLFLLKRVKQNYTGIKTVMGGGVFADDLALGSDNLTTLLAEYPFVEHVVLGEGELLFLKLLQNELPGKRVVSIADLGGATLPMQEVPPPDFSDFNPDHYYHLTIEGARSCPFQCSFCSETVQWGDYRKKTKGQFAQQVIELADQYKNNTFFMGDSLMNPYIGGLAGELIERNANILYDGYLRADKPVADRNKVKIWAQSGVFRVRLGIESASQRVLEAMDKKTSPQSISEALKSLANAGIRPTTYWIVGFPGETEDDFQETLDFIKEHHRFIYELEAHPYYYYPYGQIGSRLHQSYSLYPDGVTKVIKFKVWEIINVNPTREERYDRLRRLSKLAADLGLPNIYTMAERYQAEERWQLLHPLSREIYQGTGLRRPEINSPAGSFPSFIEAFSHSFAGVKSGPDEAHCYQISVKKRLCEETLSESLSQLMSFNEMLQQTLDEGMYVATGDRESRPSETLLVDHFEEGAGGGFKSKRSQVIRALAAEMRPARGMSVRAALIHTGESSGEFLLLVHRAVADPRSVTLLCEDLFRLYEQLNERKEVALRPIKKTYADFISELSSAGRSPQPPKAALRNSVGSELFEAATMILEPNVVRRIFSRPLAQAGAQPFEIIVYAFLRSLHSSGEESSISTDVCFDHRSLDTSLSHTVGPLTRIAEMKMQDGQDPLSFVSELKEILKEVSTDGFIETDAQASPHDRRPVRALLNLEYFVEPPWLGGDRWLPQGFDSITHCFSAPYDIECSLSLMGEKAFVSIRSHDRPEVLKLAAKLAERFTGEVDAALSRFEERLEAGIFWRSQFRKQPPLHNLEIEGDRRGISPGERASQSFAIDLTAVRNACHGTGASPAVIVLAAFSVLLSRLNGKEDVVILTAFGETPGAVPIRLTPYWKSTFREFVKEVERKSLLTFRYREHAFPVILGELPQTLDEYVPPIFDVGYVFKNKGDALYGSAALNAVLEHDPRHPPELALEASTKGNDLRLYFHHTRGRPVKEFVSALGAYMGSIFCATDKNLDIQLGEITLEEGPKSSDIRGTLAKDAFNF